MKKPFQISLFNAPTFNIVRVQKESMKAAAKKCGLSREQIVEQMNDLAGRYGVNLASNGVLKLETFEKWINPNELNRQMPMKALPIFCAVVNDTSAIDALSRPVGCRVIDHDDQQLLKWARAYFKAKDARQTMRCLERGIDGVNCG